ncbi:hypothetical protein ABES03_22925 [Neobacillus rhizosphaerae]
MGIEKRLQCPFKGKRGECGNYEEVQSARPGVKEVSMGIEKGSQCPAKR